MDFQDIEQTQDEIERLLRKLSVEELGPVASQLKVEEVKLQGQSKTAILRAIAEVIDEVDQTDQKLALFKSLNEVLPENHQARLAHIISAGLTSNIEKELLDRNRVGTEQSVVTEQTRQFGQDGSVKQEAVRDTTFELLRTLGIGNSETSMYRREFKISGSIGDGTPRELNYINLCSQINDGKKKGYHPDEIGSAVKRAITPGTGLRTYLDSQPSISLDSMLQFLRSYFREKSPTELFNELTSICQKTEEDASTFLLRALEIRQKVLVASQAEGMISYDTELVRSMFLHSVRTGIRQDSVRTHMQPFLDSSRKYGDEVLIREINVASSEETERTMKQRQIVDEKRKVKVAAAEVPGEVVDTLRELREELKSLRNEVSEMKQERLKCKSSTSQKERSCKKSSCEACKKDGKNQCSHCWKCGQDGHMSRNCQSKMKSSN